MIEPAVAVAIEPYSETDLLRLAQQGDHDAFADLQTLLESPMRRFVWRLIGSHEAEDDIIQDSLIALYLNLHRIQPAENLRPYLFRIVRNRCYDVLRKQGRFEQMSLDEEPVETWVSLHEAPAAGSQPELQRQTLILYTEESLSYQEIAEVMNCSIGTVKSRLFYAKRMLRQLISSETLALLEAEFQMEETE